MPKKTADDARLVLTLNFKLPKSYRDEFPAHRRDAIDILRKWLDDIEGCDPETLKDELRLLIDKSDSWKLEAAK